MPSEPRRGRPALAPGRMCHCGCEMEIENLIRYTERAVGLMEIEH